MRLKPTNRNIQPEYWEREALAARRGCSAAGGGGLAVLPEAGAALGVEDFFAEADGFGSDFDEFVFGDEFNGRLKRKRTMRNEPNRFVGCGRAHVGKLLFFRDVDVNVGFA